jgi:hypothetical protein
MIVTSAITNREPGRRSHWPRREVAARRGWQSTRSAPSRSAAARTHARGTRGSRSAGLDSGRIRWPVPAASPDLALVRQRPVVHGLHRQPSTWWIRNLDFGEGAGLHGAHGGGDLGESLFDQRPSALAEPHDRECTARQVLLVADVPIGREEDVEPARSAASRREGDRACRGWHRDRNPAIRAARRGGSIREIAGNDDVMVSLTLPSGAPAGVKYGTVLVRMERDGIPGERLLVSVTLAELASLLNAHPAGDPGLEHVFDY